MAHQRLVVFPPPASSNAACAFNALRFPNNFTSELIAYRAGANFLGVTLKSLYMLYIAYNPFVLHRFQPKPCFPLALIRCLRIFLVNQSFTYPNALLECPILKYCTQPRSMGLMSSLSNSSKITSQNSGCFTKATLRLNVLIK